jgi:hypothetical protein
MSGTDLVAARVRMDWSTLLAVMPVSMNVRMNLGRDGTNMTSHDVRDGINMTSHAVTLLAVT